MGADQLNSTGEWLARPGELLIEHLRGVSAWSRAFAPASLQEHAELAGLVHDLGKATSFFQRHLQEPSYSAPETNHAYISALYGAWAARCRGLDALVLFLTVARHHGPLRSPWELLPYPADIEPPDFPAVDRPGLRRTLRALARQLPEVRKSWPALCAALRLPDPLPFLEGEVWDILRQLAEEALDLQYFDSGALQNFETRRRYWQTNIVFSCLVDADKKLAARYESVARVHLDPNLVRSYLTTRAPRSQPLQAFRQQLFETVDRQVTTQPLENLFPALLTLTAPTGAGKTLAVLHAALLLRARVAQERGFVPRIIYAVPYINLIEQTVEVIRAVLEHNGVDPTSVLLEHHHLAPLTRRSSGGDAQPSSQGAIDEELQDVDEALLFAESWDAEIVVTTFVQVFHTLVGHQNRALKKLHTLVEGSILILDEVQTLDARYWPLLRALLADLPRWNVTVILMTATQPKLVEPGHARELVDPPLVGYPSRVVITPREPQSIEEFAETIVQRANQSQLVVVNSIAVSIRLFQRLRDYNLKYLFYLSTNITPRDRQARLVKIRCLLKAGAPVTLVTTQVVEAGVDLDFRRGAREWGPLESLLQVAGRVNRNAEQDRAVLEVVSLHEGQGERVYGRILLDAAREVLRSEQSDADLMQVLQEYFSVIEERISRARAQRLLEAVPRLDYDRSNIDCRKLVDSLPLSCFRLIEELPSLSIVVEQDDGATEAIKALKAAMSIGDPHRRRAAVRRAFHDLERYTITPLLQRAVGNLPPPLLYGREDLRLIRHEELRSFYDPDTGFKWDLNQFL